jgi:hypothetical protein
MLKLNVNFGIRPPFILENPDITILDGDKYPYQVTKRMVYQSALWNDVIIVPAGFKTDLASVPRLPLIFLLTGDRARKSAIVHDWLYACKPNGMSRKKADKIFLELMNLTNEPKNSIIRYSMYYGVRLGGFLPYKRGKSDLCF